MSVFVKDGQIESIVFSGHYWDQRDPIMTARKKIHITGGHSGPPKSVCTEEFWKLLCEEDCLGDLVSSLHAVYDEDNKPVADSEAVATGMQSMQTLFNKNWIAIKEEQGKFKGKIHCRVECGKTGCGKWKHYIETEHDIRDDSENHHKG